MNGRQSKLLRKKARQLLKDNRVELMTQVFKVIAGMALLDRIGVAYKIITKRA
jgi:hypothetical protein